MHFNLDIYEFGKMMFFFFCLFFFSFLFFFFFFWKKKETGTRKIISLDFTTVISFDLLCKRNNNKDGFYCKV